MKGNYKKCEDTKENYEFDYTKENYKNIVQYMMEKYK